MHAIIANFKSLCLIPCEPVVFRILLTWSLVANSFKLSSCDVKFVFFFKFSTSCFSESSWSALDSACGLTITVATTTARASSASTVTTAKIAVTYVWLEIFRLVACLDLSMLTGCRILVLLSGVESLTVMNSYAGFFSIVSIVNNYAGNWHWFSHLSPLLCTHSHGGHYVKLCFL